MGYELRTLELGFIYPTFCYCCGFFTDNKLFCSSCEKKIIPIPTYISPHKIFVSKEYYIKIFAVSAYIEPLRLLVLRKKYKDRRAAVDMGKIILERTVIKNFDIDYVIPVPLHWTRFFKRGFNQAFEIAKVLGNGINTPVINILKRNRITKFQSKLKGQQREKNLRGAFSVINKVNKNNNISGKNILLVDDLCTTGSTIKNCADALIKYKPKEIMGVVCCCVL